MVINKSSLKNIWNIARNDDKYQYSLALYAKLESKEPFTQTFELDLVKKGNIELIKGSIIHKILR